MARRASGNAGASGAPGGGTTGEMSIRVVEWFPPLFRDRAAAGTALAAAAAGRLTDDALVVGLARGGVAVAAEVGRSAGAPTTAVGVARVNTERLRLGATTAEGPPYLLSGHGVSDEVVAAIVERAQRDAAAVEERISLERPPIGGRAIVLVDDGLVTGLTLAAGCVWARAAGAARVVAAVPVGHPRGLRRVADEADDVICPHVLEQLAVVGQAYELFDPLDEWYVTGLLDDAR